MADGDRGGGVRSGLRPLHHELVHSLGPVLPRLARLRSRAALLRDPVYREVAAEIERVLDGFAWDLRPVQSPPPRKRTFTAVAWNLERGKRFEAAAHLLQSRPRLRDADLYLLTEVDLGMGRSGNRHVARDLAQALGTGWVYGNMELLLSPGDAFERDHGLDNTLAMHGCALLTRWPVSRFEAISLPEYHDKFHADEKRLGGKRALLCEVLLPEGPLTVAVVHLDPFASPRHRARQMQMVVEAIDRMGNRHVLLGGDLNTNTYDLSSKVGLAMNVAHKLVRFGFAGTVAQYMTPEQVFERGTFEAMRAAGLEIDGFNDRGRGTTHYDLHDPELDDWTRRYIPGFAHAWLRRRLEPWNCCVPLRIDWFAGRGLRPADPEVIERPLFEGRPISDHDPLIVDFEPAFGG